MKRIEIDNCPFCGHEAELILRGNNYSKKRSAEIRCTWCYVTMIVGAIHSTLEWCEEKVIEKWNKRCPLPDVEGKECEHPFAFVQTKCMGEINHCLKCGKDL